MEKYVTRRQRQELKAKKRKRILIAVIVIAALCIAGCIAMIVIRHAGTRLSKTNTKGSQSYVDSDPGSIPEYSGEDCIVLNGGKPCFNAWDLENINGEHYSDLSGRSSLPGGYRSLLIKSQGEIEENLWLDFRHDK